MCVRACECVHARTRLKPVLQSHSGFLIHCSSGSHRFLSPRSPVSLYLLPPSMLSPSLFLPLLILCHQLTPALNPSSAPLLSLHVKLIFSEFVLIHESFCCWLHANSNGQSAFSVVRLCVLMYMCACCLLNLFV